MTGKYDSLFVEETHTHPILAYWLGQNKYDLAFIELNYYEEIKRKIPKKIFFSCYNPNTPEAPPIFAGSEDWDIDLNQQLVLSHIKAKSHNHETLRFDFMMRSQFEKVEQKCGSGYFNSLLIYYMKTSDLFKEIPILTEIHENEPYKGRDFDTLKTSIHNIILSNAQHLKNDLNYTKDEAGQILENAIESYLDNRYSISNQRALGLR